MAKGRLRVKLKSFDHRVIDEAAAKILDAAVTTGAKVIGPIPLPTDRKLIVVTTSPHVDKNARDHYEMLVHKRLIDIVDPTDKTIEGLSHLDLPAGVDIEVKM
ncbi:30S ribosomal protein S10 [Candidatus Amesbacteria bacterium RIFCSPLOWO2_02_FULL_48_11]|uniref:Small ribosomal subunit protein uS10 n=5 Tax=Candidatus Amesiibacteriota TaxID=1752730 RepID=A0A1F4Z9R5_9BACT|nr:MAG: 30S ribosomal protein S10 [Candidatus Amesbacteria bacterium GW2011_GWA2_47_11]KKU94866.1 MAG: 30S ribosomal protein S10 [Candidatus Amesbacteria bacterium GW2011_GWC1_48_10]KKW01053.1 MAG: 30S ribosomal protein S10 [Candidatus Amesbacteria bacterium GW2011_GWA1_48_9]OGC89632.1 MAG: 30S ribosomal protein S10 [Candidatus Amesbacteria bacterium RBG_19FT_COMBO_48_16]OGC96876.1 MAG: 30S ribosomal protein S10 [Candidatus Amesbacteria bacterium RIFCSPHIGHO2_02_FULL_48_21]OGC97348.1 MAG: 30S 